MENKLFVMGNSVLCIGLTVMMIGLIFLSIGVEEQITMIENKSVSVEALKFIDLYFFLSKCGLLITMAGCIIILGMPLIKLRDEYRRKEHNEDFP